MDLGAHQHRAITLEEYRALEPRLTRPLTDRWFPNFAPARHRARAGDTSDTFGDGIAETLPMEIQFDPVI